MLTYYLCGDIDEITFGNFCAFINDNSASIAAEGLVVVLESDGGCAKLITPFANIIDDVASRVEVVRAYSAAFYITLLLDCPISVSLDADTMVHKAYTVLQYPAPKGDKSYNLQKKALQKVQKYLDEMSELCLSKEQYKTYMKGKEMFFNADEYNAILEKARKARKEGKFAKYSLYHEDLIDERKHDNTRQDN